MQSDEVTGVEQFEIPGVVWNVGMLPSIPSIIILSHIIKVFHQTTTSCRSIGNAIQRQRHELLFPYKDAVRLTRRLNYYKMRRPLGLHQPEHYWAKNC
jgi:hypothetical protein